MSASRKPVQAPPDSPANLPAALASVCEFLRSALAAGPVAAKQIEAESVVAGHSRATIRRARQALGIESYREGGLGKDGAWYWRLTAKASNSLSAQGDSDTAEHVSQTVAAPVIAESEPPAPGPAGPQLWSLVMLRNDHAWAKAPEASLVPLWSRMGRK